MDQRGDRLPAALDGRQGDARNCRQHRRLAELVHPVAVRRAPVHDAERGVAELLPEGLDQRRPAAGQVEVDGESETSVLSHASGEPYPRSGGESLSGMSR